VRVLLVDDHAAFRQPLAHLLRREPGVTEVDEAASVAEARPRLAGADVVVLDVHLPDGNGLDLLRDHHHSKPDAIVLVLSGSSDELELAHAIEAGASAVLDKTTGIEQIFDAVGKLGRGEAVMTSAEVIAKLRLAGRARERSADAARKLARLTPREREVLQALGDGLADKDVAVRLGVSPDTARNHVANLIAKLEVDSRLQAVLFGIRNGLIEIRKRP
jgi:DNA-binding NarL/FixJ family response regulator